MSRSNPNENNPNPSQRWYEWNGEKGLVRYYDKTTKKNVEVGTEFTFLWLDQLAGVGGWHKASDSSIYSNAVKDIRSEVLVVKAHKEGIIAEGLYKDIKDRVNSVGGYYEAQCYIAYKTEAGALAIGCLRFKGASLNAWVEFSKANRDDLRSKAVRIVGFTEGTHGRVVYRVPTFATHPISTITDAEAVALDAKFQKWLSGYLKRTTSEQVEQGPPPQDDDSFPPTEDDYAAAAVSHEDRAW